MDRIEFWSLLDRARSPDREAHEQALREALDAVAPADLLDFDRHATQLLTQSYGNRLLGAAHLITGGCTDEGFDAFRSWLVAEGRATYEAAIVNPDGLADHAELGDPAFDTLLTAARDAYERKVGSEMPDLGPPTADPDEDPNVDVDDPAALRAQYPKLFARFRPPA